MSGRAGRAARRPFSIVGILHVSISLTMATVSIAAIALVYFQLSARSRADFAVKAETSARYLRSILEPLIWNYDDAAVGILGKTMFRDEDIAALRIEDEHGKVLFEDRRQVSRDFSKAVDIARGDRKIGRAELSLTYQGESSRLLRFMSGLALYLAFVLAANLASARYMVSAYVKRPLGILAARVEGYAEGRLETGAGTLPIAELENFGRALESMASRILEQLGDLRSLNRRLEEAETEKDALIGTLRASEARLAGSLEEKEGLLRELYHRTKNNMQVICSMLSLRVGICRDGTAKAMIAEAVGHIQSMAIVHEMLYESRNLSCLDLDKYLAELARFFVSGDGGPGIDISMDLSPLAVNLNQAVPLGLIASELLGNSLRHARGGRDRVAIRISLAAREGLATLAISDDGPGLPPGLDWQSSESMGFSMIATLASQLRASIQFESKEGLRCSLTFRIE